MKQVLHFVLISMLSWSCTLISGGCCAPKSEARSSQRAPRLVDFVARDANGATLSEDYKGERMFTYSYSTNASGAKVVSVYCGHSSPQALVHRRVYMEKGVIVRAETITSDDPMTLTLEVYGPDTGKRILQDRITQGDSRRYFQRYSQQEGMSASGPALENPRPSANSPLVH